MGRQVDEAGRRGRGARGKPCKERPAPTSLAAASIFRPPNHSQGCGKPDVAISARRPTPHVRLKFLASDMGPSPLPLCASLLPKPASCCPLSAFVAVASVPPLELLVFVRARPLRLTHDVGRELSCLLCYGGAIMRGLERRHLTELTHPFSLHPPSFPSRYRVSF